MQIYTYVDAIYFTKTRFYQNLIYFLLVTFLTFHSSVAFRELPLLLRGNPPIFPHIPGREKCASKATGADETVCGDWQQKDYVENKKNAKGLHLKSLANKNVGISLLKILFFITRVYAISCYIQNINTGEIVCFQ